MLIEVAPAGLEFVSNVQAVMAILDVGTVASEPARGRRCSYEEQTLSCFGRVATSGARSCS